MFPCRDERVSDCVGWVWRDVPITTAAGSDVAGRTVNDRHDGVVAPFATGGGHPDAVRSGRQFPRPVSSRAPSRFEQKEPLTEQSKFRFMPVSETLTV